jgi:hypothetical protein
VASGGLAKIDVGYRERIGVRECAGLDVGTDAGPVELGDVVPIVSLPKAQVAAEIAPSASTLSGVAEQPLDLIDGRGDLIDLRTLEPRLRVACHADE